MRKVIGTALVIISFCVCVCALRDAPSGIREAFDASGRLPEFSLPKFPDGTLRINEAEAEELTELPGIGETLAQAIVDEKEKNGFFYFPEDLLAVRGIGPSKLAGIREWLDLSGGE